MTGSHYPNGKHSRILTLSAKTIKLLQRLLGLRRIQLHPVGDYPTISCIDRQQLGNKDFPNKNYSAYTMGHLQLRPTIQIPHHACCWLAEHSSTFPIVATKKNEKINSKCKHATLY